jgi:hypothetical protein
VHAELHLDATSRARLMGRGSEIGPALENHQPPISKVNRVVFRYLFAYNVSLR